MELLPADYVLLGIAAAMAIAGMFRGLSGFLAFAAAVAAAAVVVAFAWGFLADRFPSAWARGAAVACLAIGAFWLARTIVKKTVNGMLAQPSDAIFGLVVGVLSAALLVVAWARSGYLLEHSALASEVARYVR